MEMPVNTSIWQIYLPGNVFIALLRCYNSLLINVVYLLLVNTLLAYVKDGPWGPYNF